MGRGRSRKNNLAYLFVMPAIFLLFVFTLYPILNLIYLSFYDYNLIGKKKFVGWKNYSVLLFSKTDFLQAMRNTMVFALTVLLLSIFLAVLLAMWLRKDSFLNRLVQKSIFFPYLISTVSCAYIWSWMFDVDRGILNHLLSLCHLAKSKWLNSSEMAIFCVAVVAVWKSLGYYLLIVLYAIKAIPQNILEAASLESKNSILIFWKIILPMISPQLFFLVITITANAYKTFDLVKVMTNGGPGNSSDVLAMYIYRQAFEMNAKIGLASASATILLGITVFLTFSYSRLMSKQIFYQ